MPKKKPEKIYTILHHSTVDAEYGTGYMSLHQTFSSTESASVAVEELSYKNGDRVEDYQIAEVVPVYRCQPSIKLIPITK